MPWDVNDGAPRPKRWVPEREDERTAKPRRPSPTANRWESKLRSSLLKGKAAAVDEAST